MSYLSSPLEEMAGHYDVVVVGSGYGGAIAASRAARAGLRVCVLERGRELQPGDFPETSLEGLAEMQADLPGRKIGSPTALFDFHLNPDINALVGCGLGGTSLINANVALLPDARVWEDKCWPEGLRADLETRVADGTRRAMEMLKPTPYPDGSPTLPKLTALETSAKKMGARFYRPPITVNFQAGINHVGVEQAACNQCGDCVGGCNHSAKNALTMNYLPDARNHGAQIFTRASVRRVERQGRRWTVVFDVLEPGRAAFGAPSLNVGADILVISAGSLGSTEILLRSKAAGLDLSDRVGERFTGNGDVLGFAYNADMEVRGLGVGRSGAEGPGPCISGIVDLRDSEVWQDGMVIEEGVIPSVLRPIMPTVFAAAGMALGRDTDVGLADYAQERVRELKGFVPGMKDTAVRNTQTFLVMAHDDSAGRMSLVDDHLRITWPGVGRQDVFSRIDARLLEATKALGGTYIKNPSWTERMNHGLMTVHPLGGCPMAETAEDGVVNHKGQVFAGAAGDAVHEGLYVCDGAILSRSVGVNPFLSISSIAERNVALMAEERGWSLPYDLPSRPPRAAGPTRLGIRFTETMRGHVFLGAEEDFVAAGRRGEALDSPLSFTITVSSADLEAMLTDPGHRARVWGTVTAPALDAHPLTITDGSFQLLVPDPERIGGRLMKYRMPLRSLSGAEFVLEGFKVVKSDYIGLDMWSDTTTLYITVRGGADGSEGILGRGLLRIKVADFARQMRTLEVLGATGIKDRIVATSRFGSFFAGALFDVYGGVFARRSALDPEAPPRQRRSLRAEAPEIHGVATADGKDVRLTHFPGGSKGPVLLVPGIGMSSAVFGIDTVETNLVEFLVAHDHDVWLLDHRASSDLPHAAAVGSADEIAQLDYPAAVARVRELTGRAQVDVVGHGLGSLTLLMALVDGLEGVRSAVCSQVGLHVRVPKMTRLKAGLHLPSVLQALGKETLSAGGGGGWRDRLLDAGLRLAPIEAEEACKSAVCRRITFMYGIAFEHDQLNTATHDALHEMFGVTGLPLFSHLGKMVRAGHVVSKDGKSYLSDLGRLALPIRFIHGDENACFLPASTAETMELLSRTHGPDLYSCTVVPDYGELDCIIGKNAARDVFPSILEHLAAV